MRMTTNGAKTQNDGEGGEGGQGCKGVPIPPNFYSEFEPLIRLHGESYNPIKKAVFYSIIGSVICKNKIECKGIHEDTRVNLFLPLKSGYGKREIKQTIKKSITGIGLEYSEPTSLHPEQLIGKTITDNNGNHSVNHGHLDDDYLVLEEATELFLKDKYQEARDYIKIALDPIGQNEVYKRSVDTSKSNAVRYMPHCTITFFFQPLPLDNKLVTRGLLRRGIILFPEITKSERYLALDKSFTGDDLTSNWKKWLSALKGLKTQTFKWTFTDDIKTNINSVSKKLIQQGYEKGNKASGYTDIMFFTLRNFLIKMSCIQAAIYGRDNVTEQDVENAYTDLSIFWELQLDFVMQKVKGDMDYSDINSKEKTCLLILQEKRCFSEESSTLMIKEYTTLIAKGLDCSEENAKHYYRGLKDAGYLDARQVGRYNSKVWLTETGKTKTDPYAPLAPLTPLTSKPSIMRSFWEKISRSPRQVK